MTKFRSWREGSVHSADKKPQVYRDPTDGKTKTRMVPVDKDVVKSENSKLANLKLISKIKRSGVVKTGSMSKNEEVEQLDELSAEEKKLVNQMYDKKGNLTPLGKKVMNHGKKPGDRGYVESVDEALERDGPKKPDGLKPSFGKAASASPAVQKYMAKRAAGNQARNKAMDPGAAKKGYGIGVTDVAKADKKAKAKGTSMMKRMGSRGKMYKAGKMM